VTGSTEKVTPATDMIWMVSTDEGNRFMFRSRTPTETGEPTFSATLPPTPQPKTTLTAMKLFLNDARNLRMGG